jgi:hypothetical protein
METVALIIAVVSMTIVIYDFVLRKSLIGRLEDKEAEVAASMKVLGELHNTSVKALQDLSDRIETVEMRVSAFQSGMTSTRRL